MTGNAETDLKSLARLCRRVRQLQATYFKTRDTDTLAASKRAERELDAAVAEVLDFSTATLPFDLPTEGSQGVKLPSQLAAKLPAGRGVNLAALGLGETEAEFQAAVIAEAKRCGWAAYSVPDSRRATAGGFPDLVLLRGLVVLAAELKRRGEKPRPEQWEWLRAFGACGVRAFFWTPDDMETIREVLR